MNGLVTLSLNDPNPRRTFVVIKLILCTVVCVHVGECCVCVQVKVVCVYVHNDVVTVPNTN